MLFSSAGGYKVIYALENNGAKLRNNMERGYMGRFLSTLSPLCFCFYLLRTVTIFVFYLILQRHEKNSVKLQEILKAQDAMKIDHICIRNFIGFEEAKFEFKSNFSVIICNFK